MMVPFFKPDALSVPISAVLIHCQREYLLFLQQDYVSPYQKTLLVLEVALSDEKTTFKAHHIMPFR